MDSAEADRNRLQVPPPTLHALDRIVVSICTAPIGLPHLSLECTGKWIVALRSDGTRLEIDATACDVATAVQCLANFCRAIGNEQPVLSVLPRSYLATRSAAVLAVFLASSWRTLRDSGRMPLDLVLAHAIPVAICREVRVHIYGMIDELVSTKQLLVLARSDAVVVDPALRPRTLIERRHRRTLRRNADLVAVPGCDTGAVLDRWSEHCVYRFGGPLPTAERGVLRKVFTIKGFEAIEYRDVNGVVASALVYVDDYSRTLFDVLAPWKASGKSRRLGIYMAVRNLLRARNLGFRYSLCYGQYQYKSEIVADLPEVDL